MKPVEEYFKYLKMELKNNNSPICNSILEKIEKHNGDDLSDISKMLLFLYKLEGIRIANYREWQRID